MFANNIESVTDKFLEGMTWGGCSNFLTFVDHMSCSADTYVSLGGSNGCADQLINWDGTQRVGWGVPKQKIVSKR